MNYYADKLESLRDVFGATDVVLEEGQLRIAHDRVYPIIDDVIVILEPEQYPQRLRERLSMGSQAGPTASESFANDIQFTFGEEWQRFPDVLPDHEREFANYFDIVDLESLRDARVCDLGCGIGRWSFFLRDRVREVVLVDFSEAIFVARRNLRNTNSALFFMGDLTRLPFRTDFADFLFCIGVLHHLPTPALPAVRALRSYAPLLLIYLYYALDNRPRHYHWLLQLVNGGRRLLSKVTNQQIRGAATWALTIGVYIPLIALGQLLRPVGLSSHIPLYDAYHGQSIRRVRQDVYDRFFTRIEQRVSRAQIATLANSFSSVIVSERIPYWHFVCRR